MFINLAWARDKKPILLLIYACFFGFFIIPEGFSSFYTSGRPEDIKVLLSSTGGLKEGSVRILTSSLSFSGKEVFLDEAMNHKGDDFVWVQRGRYFKKLTLKIYTDTSSAIKSVEFRVGAEKFEFSAAELQKRLMPNNICPQVREFWLVFPESTHNLAGIFNWRADLEAFSRWFLRMLFLFLIFILVMVINIRLFNRKAIFREAPVKNGHAWFLAISLSLLSFAFTYLFSFFGFRWDEHLIAYGGHLIAQGAIPYLDFGLPLGPLVFILQVPGHILFKESFFAYGYSAAILNSLIVFFVSVFLIKVIRLSSPLVILGAIIAHFSFFGASGCLWYNQVAALWFSLAIIILLSILRLKWSGFRYYIAISVISVLTGLTILTKHDIGLLLYAGIPALYFLILKKNYSKLKAILSVSAFFLIPVFIVVQAILHFSKLGGDPFYWINIGQAGYISRLDLFRWFTSSVSVLTDISFAPLIFSFCFVSLLVFMQHKDSPKNNRLMANPYFVLMVFVLAVSLIIRASSGLGAGYLIPHLSLLGVIILLFLLVDTKKNEFRLCVFPLLMLCMLCLAIPMANDFLMRYKFDNFKRIEQGSLKGLLVTDRTKKLLETYHDLVVKVVRQEGRKLTVWSSSGLYQALHPNVVLSAYGGPLWMHLGVSNRLKDYDDLLVSFAKSKPDIIILEDFFYRLNNDCAFAKTGLISRYISENYNLVFSGYTDPIGSGGFSMEHFVFLRKGLKVR